MNWSVMNMVCYEYGLLWTGLLWTWSVINGSVMNGSVMNVVCYEWSVLSGLLWAGLFGNGHRGTHTAQKSASLFWCDAVMSLQCTHFHSFTCRLTLRNLRAHYSTVSLSCVTITWQRIFKGSLQVTIIALFRMWLLTSDIFGRWCSETVTVDNGKTRFILLNENKQGWIYSNASSSTSFKIHYSVRLWVWPMCL